MQAYLNLFLSNASQARTRYYILRTSFVRVYTRPRWTRDEFFSVYWRLLRSVFIILQLLNRR